MRVLQLCAAYKPAFIYGGPTMSVSMLSEQLANSGAETEVFATTANGKTELPVAPNQPVNVDGVKVTYFKRLTKDHSHFSPALLKKLWTVAPGFQLIHVHAWWNLVSLFACTIALMRGVPVLVSPRGTLSPYSFQNKNIGLKWLIHQLYGKHLLVRSHIHVTSLREMEAVSLLIRPKSMTILPNFVRLPEKMPIVHRKSPEQFKLLFFSRIAQKKGLEILLDALLMVDTPYTLTVAGDGDEQYIQSLKAMAENNNITAKINWAGFTGEDKFSLLAEHDLLVLPSYDENFGNVVIESLSVGTAVLLSEQVGLAGYVSQHRLGWVCRTNPASVGEAIDAIAKNHRAELDRIRSDAPQIIYKDFNENNLVKRYLDMYDQFITK